MTEMKVTFETPEQIKHFCTICQKMEADIDVVNPANRYDRIDGKSIIGLMTMGLQKPLLVQVHGDNETKARELFREFSIPDNNRGEKIETGTI